MLPYLQLAGLNVPMYGIMLAAGFLLTSAVSYIRTKKRGMKGDNLILIAAFVFLCAMAGGMLLYILVTYTPEQIGRLISEGRWNELFGGIVFYGALIGGVLGGLLGSLVAKEDIRDYLDIVVPVIPLGHAIGRIGCFCAGCCYGQPTDSPLGVVYTHPIGGAPTGIRLFPIQLAESCVNLVIFVVLMIVSKRTSSRYLTTFLYCIFYGTARFILEFFRYDSIRGTAGGLSTSQWVSLAMVAGALICMLIRKMVRVSD